MVQAYTGIGIGLTNACAQFGYVENTRLRVPFVNLVRSGIVGPHVFSTVFGPRYRTSYAVNLSVLVVGICAILASWLLVVRKDRRQTEPSKEG